MQKFSRKVAIIGIGNVGIGTAYTIVNQGITDELILIDKTFVKAEGQAWDLSDAVLFLPTRTKIRAGTYQDLKDVDIIVIAASGPAAYGDRLTELTRSTEITSSIVKEAIANGFDGIFIVQSNPVDIITYHILQESGFPKNRVIGTGTSLDCSRLRRFIAEICGDIDARAVDAFTIGEHGDSQVTIWSGVKIGGKSFLELRKENPQQYAKQTLEELHQRVLNIAWGIIERKGNTSFGVGAAAAQIIKAIFHDEKLIITSSSYLNGEYGEYDLVASVPSVIGSNGIEHIIELDMNLEEEAALQNSFNTIRKYSQKIKIID